MNRAEILVVDDEPQIRRLLQINLENNNYKVVQANSGEEAIRLAASHPPDLILLDIGLPDKSGHEVLQELRKWYSSPIIILSVQDTEDNIVSALDHGATDYIAKPFRTGELLARIRSAIRLSQNTQNNPICICGDIEIDFIARVVKKRDVILKLTATEFNLLALLAKNEGKVLTHQYILKEIWGYGHLTETQYLRVFVRSLRRKIENDPNNPQKIITESGIGYRFQ